MGQLSHLNQGDFNQQALVLAQLIVDVAVGTFPDSAVEELRLALLCLLIVALANIVVGVKQLGGLLVSAHQQIAQMCIQSIDEMTALEALVDDFVIGSDDVRNLLFQEEIYQLEVVVIVQYIQIGDGLLVGDVSITIGSHLIEDGQCITHTSIGLFGNDGQSGRFGSDAFLFSHLL